MIDQDRDGIIGADDLQAIYQQVGRYTSSSDVDKLLLILFPDINVTINLAIMMCT